MADSNAWNNLCEWVRSHSVSDLINGLGTLSSYSDLNSEGDSVLVASNGPALTVFHMFLFILALLLGYLIVQSNTNRDTHEKPKRHDDHSPCGS